MLRTVSFVALQAGEQVEVSPGDTLEVMVSFTYLVPEGITVKTRLSLGSGYKVEDSIPLEHHDEEQEWSGSLFMPIDASGTYGTLKNQTYDLWFELPGSTGEKAVAYGAVVVTGISGGIMDLIPMLMVVMMMGMMMSIMAEEE